MEYRERVLIGVQEIHRIREKPEFPRFQKTRANQHAEAMNRLAILAAENVQEFAKMVADETIPCEFQSLLCRSRYLHKYGYMFGVLPILKTTASKELLQILDWYMQFHYENNLDIHDAEKQLEG